MKIHMRTHDVKKQYKCHRCNKGYNTVSAFSFHEKSHEKDDLGTNSVQENYSKILSGSEDCDECDGPQVQDFAKLDFLIIFNEEIANFKYVLLSEASPISGLYFK